MKQTHEQETRRSDSTSRRQKWIKTDNELPEVPDIATDGEDSREAQVSGARTIMDLDVCVPRGPDDDHVEAAGTTTNLTKEPSRLDTSGMLRESVVDEMMRRGQVCSRKADTVCDKTLDEVKNNRNESRFMAARLTGNVMDDAHDGTMTLETLRMDVNLVTADEGKHRLCDTAFHDTATTIVPSSTDEAVESLPQGGMLEKGECPS